MPSRIRDNSSRRLPRAALSARAKNACAHRIDELEREILQLAEKLVETEPVGNRRVNLERLASDAAAFVGTYRSHRLQIVMTIGELDQHHAQIARHGHQHLAEVLRLRLFVRLELDLVELRQAIDEIGNRLPKRSAISLLPTDVSSITSCKSAATTPRHPSAIRRSRRHGQRMGDVGFSRQAHLPAMRASLNRYAWRTRSISSGGR
jgi:hypothetical protein